LSSCLRSKHNRDIMADEQAPVRRVRASAKAGRPSPASETENDKPRRRQDKVRGGAPFLVNGE
jgi:hypothetical protein